MRKNGVYYGRRRLPGVRHGEVSLTLRTRRFTAAGLTAAGAPAVAAAESVNADAGNAEFSGSAGSDAAAVEKADAQRGSQDAATRRPTGNTIDQHRPQGPCRRRF